MGKGEKECVERVDPLTGSEKPDCETEKQRNKECRGGKFSGRLYLGVTSWLGPTQLPFGSD